MSDLISRDDAIRELNGACSSWEDDAKVAEIIDALPSAEAVSADAEWIPREHFDVLKKNYDMLAGLLEEAKARAIGAWIPCSKRLPETHTEYVKDNPWIDINWFKDTYQLSDPVFGYGKRKGQSDDDPMMAVVWYEDDGGGRTGWITCPDCEDIDIVAWMPLPKPYREDGEA